MDYDEEWQNDLMWPNDSYSLNGSGALNSSASTKYESPLSPELDRILNICLAIVMFVTMVSLGCTMHWSKIKEHIKNPRGMIIAAGAQFGIMPLSAFILAKAFQLEPLQAVAVMVCGCCPGGTLSNMLTLAMQGDMNLSIVMTSCSSVLALGMMPLLLYVYCQGFPGLVEVVPYGRIILALVSALIPCSIGILITHYRPQWTKLASRVILVVMTVAIFMIITVAAVTVGTHIFLVMSSSLITIGCILPLIGFVLGYCLAAIFKLSERCRRTISIETGCQNINLAMSILKLGFHPDVIGPLFMFPIVYILFQLTEVGVFIVLTRCYQKFKTNQKDVVSKPTNAYVEVEVVMDVSLETHHGLKT